MKLLLNIIVLVLLVSCSEKQTELENPGLGHESSRAGVVHQDTLKDHKFVSILDSIRGDKLLDLQTKKIRANNFQNFIGIAEKDLCDSSTLYTIKRISENYYLLQQKRSYKEARQFNALLKTRAGKVVDYFILNDFSVRDVKKDKTGWLLLCCDWDNTNVYWKSKQQILILDLDTNFKTTWKYEADNVDYPLDAVSIEQAGETSVYKLHVITGCHICLWEVRLELDEKGKFRSVKEIAVQNSRKVDVAVLNSLFNVNRNKR